MPGERGISRLKFEIKDQSKLVINSIDFTNHT